MMGERTVMQEALFYSFSLDRHVPSDHMLRDVGRPSIDPELTLIRERRGDRVRIGAGSRCRLRRDAPIDRERLRKPRARAGGRIGADRVSEGLAARRIAIKAV